MRQSIRINILPVVFAVIVFGSAYFVCALNITDCADKNNGTFTNNTNLNCNFTYIYCDGEDSEYCNENYECDEANNCTEIVAVDDVGATNTTAAINTTNATTIDSTIGPSLATTATPSEDVRAICRRGVTEKYIYPDNCNYYFYCMEGFLIVEQCPMGFVFNETARACMKRTLDFNGCK